MTYVQIKERIPVEITLQQFIREQAKNGVSGPDFPSIQDEKLRNARLAAFDVFPSEVVKPSIDADTQKYGEWTIEQDPDGNWVKRLAVIELTEEEKMINQRKRERQRKEAMQRDMRDVADPVFMKYQAGEATREEWLSAREIVRSWYADNN